MKKHLRLQLVALMILLCASVQMKAQAITGSVTITSLGNGNMQFTVGASAPAGWPVAASINYGDLTTDNTGIDTTNGYAVFTHQYTNGTYYIMTEVYALNAIDSTYISDIIYDTIVVTDYTCFVNVSSIHADNVAGLMRPFSADYVYPAAGNAVLNWRVEDSFGMPLGINEHQQYMQYTFPGYGNFRVWFSINFTDAITSQTCADSAYVDINVHDSCMAQANVQITSLGGTDAILEGSVSGLNPTSQYITVDGGTYYTDSMFYTFSVPPNTPSSILVCYYAQDTTYPGGCSVSACDTYVTSGTPDSCNAYFTLQQDSANPTVWYGTNLSTGAPTMTYFWDFGDGTSSTLPALTHNYAVPGNYIICLTIQDSATNCMSTYCDSSAYFSRPDNANTIGSLIITAPNVVGIAEARPALSETKLFPNPMTETALITFNAALASNGKIEVVNILGAKVMTENVAIAKGNNEFKLNTASLASGVYYVNVIAENKILKTLKAVK